MEAYEILQVLLVNRHTVCAACLLHQTASHMISFDCLKSSLLFDSHVDSHIGYPADMMLPTND